MRLLLFRSLWTNGFDPDAALADVQAGDYDGIEGPVSAGVLDVLERSGVPFIAEVTTGGGYVPTRRAKTAHFDEFRAKADAALAASPLFITALVGCDAWPLAQSVEFLGECHAHCEAAGVRLSVETHRSRPTFTPWATAEILRQLPMLRLTCDFSHWCCVTERLVMDEEREILKLCAAHRRHVHARVGYEQGPQVPHPAAAEYHAALAAHERWWAHLWRTAAARGEDVFTMTPEFGPDGYLHSLPFTDAPVASLDCVNLWIARRLRALSKEWGDHPMSAPVCAG